MNKTKIRKDDYVMILAGKDKGKTAQVIAVDKTNNRVYVEGQGLATVNTKAVKARRPNEKSGLIKRPGSVDISNVLPVCSACGKTTKIGISDVDGSKVRICKKCGAVLVTKKTTAKAAAKATVRKKTTAVKRTEVAAEEPKAEVVKKSSETDVLTEQVKVADAKKETKTKAAVVKKADAKTAVEKKTTTTKSETAKAPKKTTDTAVKKTKTETQKVESKE